MHLHAAARLCLPVKVALANLPPDLQWRGIAVAYSIAEDVMAGKRPLPGQIVSSAEMRRFPRF